MSKPIGKGEIIHIDNTQRRGRLSCACKNGMSGETEYYGFFTDANPGLVVEDKVLFLEDLAPSGSTDGEASNLVAIPNDEGCVAG